MVNISKPIFIMDKFRIFAFNNISIILLYYDTELHKTEKMHLLLSYIEMSDMSHFDHVHLF